MKAITLWQPWASLIGCGAKQYETRSWATSYRGPIAIHAATKSIKSIMKACFPLGEWNYAPDYEAKQKLLSAIGKVFHDYADIEDVIDYMENLPFGCVIATAELVNCWYIVHHPGTDVDTTRHIPIGAESMTNDRHAPDFGDFFVPTDREQLFGDWTPGRYAWELVNVKMLDAPIPVKGKQGLWEWDAAISQKGVMHEH